MGWVSSNKFMAVAAVLFLAAGPSTAQQAGSASTGVSAPEGSSSVPEAYRINPGDELLISVWGEERLNTPVRVLPDGTIAFPLVGNVMAAGSLPAEIEQRIEQGLAPQFRGAVPQVTVSVRNTAGLQFSVIGRVRNPGTFTPGRYVNALEALSFAGGPTEFAKLEDVYIVRKSGAGLEPVRVRLGRALKREPSTLTAAVIPQIQSGDTVVVP